MLRTIWLVLLMLSLTLLLVSVILIFVWKIPDLVDELSGRKAKRQIQRLKELNAGTGSLEDASTEDVYSTVSSGSLLSRAIADVGNENDVQVLDYVDEKENLDTNSDTDESTTGILSSVQELPSKKKTIIVIEEQTSL